MREHGPVEYTPSYAPPSDPTAVFGRRVVAWLIDAVIAIVIVIVTFATLAESQDVGSSAIASEICSVINDTEDSSICIESGSTVILAEGGDIGTMILVVLIYFFASQVVLAALTGASLGKLLVGLRVVDKNTFAKAGFGKQILRWILWIADGFGYIPFVVWPPVVGGIVALSSKGHRRVGDMAAGTLVVDRKMVGQPVAVPGANDLPAIANPGAVYGTPPPPPTGPPPAAPPPIAPPVAAPPSEQPVTEPPPTEPPPTQPPADDLPPPIPPPDATTPLEAPPPDATTPLEAPPPDATTPLEAPAEVPPPPPPAAPEPPPPPAPEPAARPGIDAPQWDEARDTYIQWDPELQEWMEWSESRGALDPDLAMSYPLV